MAELAAGRGDSIRPEPPDMKRRLELEQFRLLFAQYRRVTLPVLAVTLGIAYVVAGSAPAAWIAIWAAINVVMPLVRWWICRRYLDSTAAIEARYRQARWLAHSAFLPGLWTGAAAPLFMPWLGVEDQAILTMIIVCNVAGALSSSAPYPPTFYGYGSTMILLLAGTWAYGGRPAGTIAALLLLLMLGALIAFVRDNNRIVRESIQIRFEREPLLEEQRRLIAQLQEANVRAEEARRQAELANKAKSNFLAAAAHDLRQPLHAISLLSAVLGEVSREGTVREISTQMARSIESLDRLFSALLDLSRLDAGVVTLSRTAVACGAIFAPLLDEYRQRAEARGVAWRCQVDDATVELDLVKTERILRNLLDNAVKYTDGGVIAVGIQVRDGTFRVRVADSGPGIPETERQRVFEDFYQIGNRERDRSKGLGLGLAIVRRLVDLLGGRIELRTSEFGGAEFEVALPAGQDGCLDTAAPEGRESGWLDLTGLSVLVIDDDLEVRDAMGLTLRHWNCAVRVARDLGDALDLVGHEGVDVVISDYRLAGNVVGTTVLARVLARWPGARGLLITGDMARADLKTIRASGFPLMHKPVPYGDLRAFLAAALAARRDAREGSASGQA